MVTNNDDVQQTVEIISEKAVSRRVFRSLVFHFVYALDAYQYQEELGDIIAQFNKGYDLDISRNGDIATMVQAIADEREDLDKQITPQLANWRLERLSCVTLLILRIGLWEILHTKTPINIIINEAVELAKNFAEEDAFRFVNGILDQLSQKIHLKD